MSSSVPPSRDPSSRGFAGTLVDRFRAGLNTSRDRSGDARFRREGEPPVIEGAPTVTPRTDAVAAAPVVAATPVAPDHEHGKGHASARRRSKGIAGAKGSRSLGGATAGRRGAWLLPLLLTIGLAALLALAIAAFFGSDGNDGGNANREPAGQRDTGGQAAPAAAPVRPGALGVNGRSVPTGATLKPFVGQQVDARGLEVVQVDKGGFFVGGGKGERTFVEYGARAGGDEATRMPSVGDRVNLTGPIAEAPRQPGRTLGVPVASERVILKQGGYVNADEVTPAG